MRWAGFAALVARGPLCSCLPAATPVVTYEGVEQLHQVVTLFIESARTGWLIERLGHRTPREAFNEATAQVAA